MLSERRARALQSRGSPMVRTARATLMPPPRIAALRPLRVSWVREPTSPLLARSAPVDDVGPESHRVSWNRPRPLALDRRKQKRTHRQEWCFDRQAALTVVALCGSGRSGLTLTGGHLTAIQCSAPNWRTTNQRSQIPPIEQAPQWSDVRYVTGVSVAMPWALPTITPTTLPAELTAGPPLSPCTTPGTATRIASLSVSPGPSSDVNT